MEALEVLPYREAGEPSPCFSPRASWGASLVLRKQENRPPASARVTLGSSRTVPVLPVPVLLCGAIVGIQVEFIVFACICVGYPVN